MIINFRQGIVSYQDGGFLQVDGSGNINLLADQPVIVTIAHKDTDYLHIENEPVNSAWTGPFDPNKKYWLYWDFDLQNFSRTFGYTTLEPVAQNSEPGHGDAEIVEFIPGTGSGGIRINGYFYYLTGKKLTLYNTPGGTNDGTFTVVSSSFNPSTNLTTVVFAETVSSSSPGGFVTTDTDSNGIPLKTEGRHWFDTRNFIHYEFKNGQWVEVLRVFAGVVTNGSIISSPSTNTTTGEFSGSQIGINKDGVRAGRVVFDRDNVPVKRYNKTFFTAEDDFYLNGSRIDRVRLESVVKDFKAGENIGQDAVVAVSHTGDVFLAKYEDVGEKVLGIALNSALFGETVTVAFSGIISSGNWNWLTGPTPVNVGADLWVDNGILVTQDPGVTNTALHPEKKKPIGRVLSNTEIYFNPLNTGDVVNNYFPAGAGGGDPASTSEPGVVFLSYPPTDPNYPVVVTDNDPRLYDARPPLPHTHNAVDIIFNPAGNVSALHVQGAIEELDNEKVNILGDTMGGPLLLSRHPLLEMEATTKAYVDSLTSGLIWLNPISLVNLISDNVDSPPASPELGDSYIIPPSGGLGSWSSFAPGNVVTWDGTQWVNNGPVTSLDSGSGIRLGVAMTSGTTPSGSFAGQKNNIALFDNSGTLTGFETPSQSNAVYVSRSGSPYEFRQFVFDGTQWKQFGGGGNGITAGNNLYFTGNTLNVLDFSAGGTIDAATLQGYVPADFAPASHTHILPATNINVNNFTGTIGSLPTDNLQNILQQLVEEKADNTPVWTTSTLPDPVMYKGMLVFNEDLRYDISRRYGASPIMYSDGDQWISLAEKDHCHLARYELHWYWDGDFTTVSNGDILGSIAIIQDTVIIPPCVFIGGGVPIHDSHVAIAETPPWTESVVLEVRVKRYSSLVDHTTETINTFFGPPPIETWNTITFNLGNSAGEFIMTTAPLILKKYDIVELVVISGAGQDFGPVTVTASGATPIGHPAYDCESYYKTIQQDGGLVTLSGPFTVISGSTNTYTITNYTPDAHYSVTATGGNATISGNLITFVAPTINQEVLQTTLIVNYNNIDVPFEINVIKPYINIPVINSPVDGTANITNTQITITLNPFSVYGAADTHVSTDWELATDPNFSNIIDQSYDDTINLLSWTVTLTPNTTYYVRARFTGQTLGKSKWSDTVRFSTAEYFVANREFFKLLPPESDDPDVTNYFRINYGSQDTPIRISGNKDWFGIPIVSENNVTYNYTNSLGIYSFVENTPTLITRVYPDPTKPSVRPAAEFTFSDDGQLLFVSDPNVDVQNTFTGISHGQAGAITFYNRTFDGINYQYNEIVRIENPDQDEPTISMTTAIFGNSVVLDLNPPGDPSYLIASAPGAYDINGSGIRTGCIFVFEISSLITTLDPSAYNGYEERIQPSDYASFSDPSFGNVIRMIPVYNSTLGITEKFLIVGAPNTTQNGTQSGKIYVLKYQGGSWNNEVQQIIPTGTTSYTRVGDFIETDIVQKKFFVSMGTLNAIREFSYNETTQLWEETNTITPVVSGYSRFTVENNVMYISYPYQSTSGLTENGFVDVYVYNKATNTWDYNSRITASDAANYDWFGSTLALNSKLLVLASGDDNERGTDARAVYIFY